MASVLVSELITRAQQASDMTDDFISQATWLYWANAENRLLYNRMARSGYPINTVAETITTTGATEYNLNEPNAIIGVRGFTSAGKCFRIPVKRLHEQKYSAGVKKGTPQECYINCLPGQSVGQIQIIFYPNPQSGTYVVDIIDKPAALTLTTDNVKFPGGLEERVVLGMARRALGKEETVNPAIERMIQEAEQNVDNFIHSYLTAEQPTVRDVNEVSTYVPYTEWLFV